MIGDPLVPDRPAVRSGVRPLVSTPARRVNTPSTRVKAWRTAGLALGWVGLCLAVVLAPAHAAAAVLLGGVCGVALVVLGATAHEDVRAGWPADRRWRR